MMTMKALVSSSRQLVEMWLKEPQWSQAAWVGVRGRLERQD